MTFPTVQSTNTSVESSAVTSHDVSLPTGIAAGDLLLVFALSESGISGFSGWTQLGNVNLGFVYYRVANGSEGATAIFTSSSAGASAHNSYRISGADPTPEAAGNTNTGDPPSLNPTGWDVDDTLWIAATLALGSSGVDVTAAPTNYTNLVDSGAAVSLFGGGLFGVAASARRQNAVSSEDPGAFGTANMSGDISFTVAVRPAQPGQPTTKRTGGVQFTHSWGRGPGRQVWAPVMRPSMLIGPSRPIRRAA